MIVEIYNTGNNKVEILLDVHTLCFNTNGFTTIKYKDGTSGSTPTMCLLTVNGD